MCATLASRAPAETSIKNPHTPRIVSYPARRSPHLSPLPVTDASVLHKSPASPESRSRGVPHPTSIATSPEQAKPNVGHLSF